MGKLKELIENMDLLERLNFNSIQIKEYISICSTIVTGAIMANSVSDSQFFTSAIFCFLSASMLTVSSIEMKKFIQGLKVNQTEVNKDGKAKKD